MSQFVTILKWFMGLFLIFIFIITAFVYVPVLSNPTKNYFDRKGEIVSSVVNRQWKRHDSLYSDITINSKSGLEVKLLIRRPIVQQEKLLPAVLLLGGLETGRKSCELIPNIGQIICASISYPRYTPKRYSGINFFYRMHEVQETIKDTPPAVGLATDYLLQKKYIDKQRLEYIGVSLGAFFISVPAAMDSRIARVWLVQGAAKPITVIEHAFLSHIDSERMATIFAHLIGYAIGAQYIDPLDWVYKISPRKVVFLNSEQDEALPLSNVEALHQAALQPKKIIWVKGTHITSSRKNVIRQLSDVVLSHIDKNSAR